MNRKVAMLFACAGAALCAGTSAFGAADTLYGCEYPGFHDLSTLDQSTGALTNIGPTGRNGLLDMTSDTRDASFTMWAVQGGSNELVTLDPISGAEIGAVTLDSPDQMTSIAFDVVSGKLYGNTTVGFGASFDALYEINPVNGACTFIGRILFNNVYALGFDQNGTLFGADDETDSLITISTATGNGAFVADLATSSNFDMASRPSDGVMFLADSSTFHLYTVDTSDGSLDDIGPYDPTGTSSFNVVGLAFGPVPAPGAGVVLALAGVGIVRRRRA